ncbi:MAG: TlpA family protein disulfide reductase [Treponema sp.]
MKQKILLFALIVMFLVPFASCSKQKAGSGASSQTQAAPDFSLTLSTGENVRLSDFRGKAVLLHFWATWCPPCRAELPEMNKLAESLAADPESKLEFLAVCISDEETSRAQFMSKNGYTFKGGLDARGEVASLYRVQGIPSSFIISPDGSIERRHVGAMSKAQLADFVSGYYEK